MDEVFPLEDGVGLNVVRSGAPDAPVTVVLAHGYALDHRSWHRVIPELAHDELQVVAYDHRGHGQSGPATPETASIEQLGDDLAEVIDRGVDSERVGVVGHSLGGMATMALVVDCRLGGDVWRWCRNYRCPAGVDCRCTVGFAHL